MKKITPGKKLQLLRSTVRDLKPDDLTNVVGGVMAADAPPSKVCATSKACCTEQ